MAHGTRKKQRQTQNGVNAIFTAKDAWKTNAPAVAGGLAASTGAAMWAWTFVESSSSLSLISTALLTVIGGASLLTYSLAVRRTRRESNRIRSALYELEAMMEQKNGAPDSSPVTRAGGLGGRKHSPFRLSRVLAIALFEAFLLIVVYSGLVQEYASNSNMQQWVRANLFPATYVLNFSAVFVIGGTLLGALAIQLRFGKEDSPLTR